MAKKLTNKVRNIIDKYEDMKDDDTGIEDQEDNIVNTNYFLTAVKNTGYDKTGAKELQNVINRERKVRRNLAMRTLNFKDKAKTLWNYYTKKKNTYHFPEMSAILGAEVETMVARSSELETIINQFKNSGEKLNSYYFRILDEMEESYNSMSDAQNKKNDIKVELSEIEGALLDSGKVKYSERIELLRTKKSLTIEYGKQNIRWADNGYNEQLRAQEIMNLESVSDFITAMNSSSALVLRFSKVLGDHIENTRFIYDMVPELFLKENQIEVSQHKLADAVIEYKDVLADLYRHKFQKLGRLVGLETAREMLGSNVDKNINLLRSGG